MAGLRSRDPRLAVDIVDVDRRWLEKLPRVRMQVRRAAIATLRGARLRFPRAGVTLAVALVSNADIRRLNREHRAKDRPTNVLSYPAVPTRRRGEPRFLGDIVIASDTVWREAKQQHKPVAHHLIHLVVHGTLHLLGFDHERAEEAERMEALERRILAPLHVPDPYGER